MEKIVIQETGLYKMTQIKQSGWNFDNAGRRAVRKVSAVMKVQAGSRNEAEQLIKEVEGGTPQIIEVEDASEAIVWLAKSGILAQKVFSSDAVSTTSRKKPDVLSMGREDILSTLMECEGIVKKIEALEATEEEQVREICAETAKADELKIAISKKAKLIKWGILLAVLLLGYLFIYNTGNVFLGILIFLAIYITGRIIVTKKDLEIHANENEANARAYYTEHVAPLEEKFANTQLQIEEVYNSGEVNWVIDIVGEEFCASDSIGELINLIKGRRADSLKEAINLYDDIKSRERMEEMQMAIKEASEKTAVEAAKQTAQMKTIEKNTHQAATAAKVTAATSYGTYRNVRKIRKRIK